MGASVYRLGTRFAIPYGGWNTVSRRELSRSHQRRFNYGWQQKLPSLRLFYIKTDSDNSRTKPLQSTEMKGEISISAIWPKTCPWNMQTWSESANKVGDFGNHLSAKLLIRNYKETEQHEDLLEGNAACRAFTGRRIGSKRADFRWSQDRRASATTRGARSPVKTGPRVCLG